MPGGTPIQLFNDFTGSQPSVYRSSPTELVNDAQLRNYPRFNRFFAGRAAADMLKAGSFLKEKRVVDGTSTAVVYNPGASRALTNRQITSDVQAGWRFVKDHMTWTEQEIVLNPANTATETENYVKSVRKIKEIGLWTSKVRKLNDQINANAHNAQASMETMASNTPAMYSYHSMFTENNSTYLPDGWTTLMGVNPTTDDTWRNPVYRYDNQDKAGAVDSTKGLFVALHKMFLDLGYKGPETREQYFENVDFQQMAIWASMLGVTQLFKLQQDVNDRYIYNSNGTPVFLGIPIEYEQSMDSIAIYKYGASSYTTENDTTNLSTTSGTAWSTTQWCAGARYNFENFKYSRMFFQTGKFMDLDKTVVKSQTEYDTYFQEANTWGNALLLSRRMGGGVVGPGA